MVYCLAVTGERWFSQRFCVFVQRLCTRPPVTLREARAHAAGAHSEKYRFAQGFEGFWETIRFSVPEWRAALAEERRNITFSNGFQLPSEFFLALSFLASCCTWSLKPKVDYN